MEKRFVDKMKIGLDELGIILSEKQMEQFYQYYQLLIQWNTVMNLTTITELDEVITKHFIDSLALVKGVEDLATSNGRLMDVGTGAGFPGIPLKIAFPNLKITLLDSLNKKVNFLNEVIKILDLKEISAIHGRTEDFGNDSNHREQYDYCVSRAVANIATLCEYCVPYIKINGVFISYKSGKIDEELAIGKHAIFLLGGTIKDVIKFQLADSEADRSLVVVVKKQKTPKMFPRKAGLPSKKPLS